MNETIHGPLINGESSTGGTAREMRCPYDDRLIGRVDDATPGDVNRAMETALKGAETMRRMHAHQRAAILLRAAALLGRDHEEIARLITGECAKPIRDARLEVDRGIQTLTVSAEEGKRLGGEMVPMDAAPGGEGKIAWTRREPRGVVAAVTPFNFPLNLVLHKVAPALASGNAVALKPAPVTPLTSLKLGRVLLEAGLPPEAIAVLPGGTETAQALVCHQNVAMVTFTGSVPAGRAIQAAVPHKKVTLELGNTGAVIVAADADVDRAVERCVPAAYAFSGQVCISLQRVYVHASIAEDFTRRFVEAARSLKVGNPFDEETRVSALISSQAADRVEQWVREAMDAGAEVLLEGRREGNVISPAVLFNVPETCKLVCEEVFGPVAVINTYEVFDDALDKVNATSFGLQAGVFTSDIATAMRAVELLRMGAVLINEAPNFRMDSMPYGGIKDSGVGREGPRYAIEDMTELKLVVLHSG